MFVAFYLNEVRLAVSFCLRYCVHATLHNNGMHPNGCTFLFLALLAMQVLSSFGGMYCLFYEFKFTTLPIRSVIEDNWPEISPGKKKMNQGDDQVRCLGICNWLYNLITKTISAQTLKTVTLGETQPESMSHATKSESDLSAPQSAKRTQITPSKTDTNHKALPSLPASDFSRKKAPKKSVSINDKVEEIVEYKRKTSLKLALPRNRRRSVSMDLDDKDGEKPLKSILKVSKGANLLARSTSFG